MTFGFLGYPVSQAADIMFVNATWCRWARTSRPYRADARHRDALQPASTARSSPMPDVADRQGAAPAGHRRPGQDEQEPGQRHLPEGRRRDGAQRKVMSMYTDPTRLRATDPGHVEGNPVFTYHDAFNPDKARGRGDEGPLPQGASATWR